MEDVIYEYLPFCIRVARHRSTPARATVKYTFTFKLPWDDEEIGLNFNWYKDDEWDEWVKRYVQPIWRRVMWRSARDYWRKSHVKET